MSFHSVAADVLHVDCSIIEIHCTIEILHTCIVSLAVENSNTTLMTLEEPVHKAYTVGQEFPTIQRYVFKST